MELIHDRQRIISVPSKTFLLGEYVALVGGPSLVLATNPRFEYRLVDSATKQQEAFHPESPAGRWLARQRKQESTGEWVDPHAGRGGFGASTAQFISARIGVGAKSLSTDFESILKILQEYQSTLDGFASGADLVGQICGQCTWWGPKSHLLETSKWPWEEIDFQLYRTGKKVETHRHLEEITRAPNWSQNIDYLLEIVRSGHRAWEDQDSDDFVEAVGRFAFAANDMGLVCDETQKTLEKLTDWPEILVAKGCGALGADVIAVLLPTEQGPFLRVKMRKLGLEFVADKTALTTGVECHVV